MLIFALLSSVVLARFLGPENRGIFALVLLLPEIAGTFGNMGFQSANAVYAGLEPESRSALAWHSVVLALVFGGLSALASWLFLQSGSSPARSIVHAPIWMYLVALTTIPMIILNEYWNSIVRGMNRIGTNNIIEVSQKLASVVMLLTFVGVFKLGVRGAVWADWIYNLGVLVPVALVLHRFQVLRRPSLDPGVLKRTGRFAGASYIGGILTYLNYRVDQLIIAMLLPPAQLAFYSIAVAIAERIWIPTGAVATALLPHLTTQKERDPSLAVTIARHTALVTAAGCLIVALLARLGIRIMYGSAFLPAVRPLQWLLPGIFALTISKVLVSELSARKKVDYSIYTVAFATAVNIGGNLVLIPRLGITGASVASSISYAVLSLSITAYYIYETKVDWRTFLVTAHDLRLYLALAKDRKFGKFAEAVARSQRLSAVRFNGNAATTAR